MNAWHGGRDTASTRVSHVSAGRWWEYGALSALSSHRIVQHVTVARKVTLTHVPWLASRRLKGGPVP